MLKASELWRKRSISKCDRARPAIPALQTSSRICRHGGWAVGGFLILKSMLRKHICSN